MNKLPKQWHSQYEKRREEIQSRLRDFSKVQEEKYFYELAYCILTPGTRAANAEKTIANLEQNKFLEHGFDPTSYLRNPDHCIRFHNTKAKRLLEIRKSFDEILPIIKDVNLPASEKRNLLFTQVNGLGMKEASHFLRNIGVRGLGILDRHILNNLQKIGVIEEIPASLTQKRYLEIEKKWKAYAKKINVPLDELDLLFWSMGTKDNKIRK